MGEGFVVGIWVESGLVVSVERCDVVVVQVVRGFGGCVVGE
jgi:hypothetical protein